MHSVRNWHHHGTALFNTDVDINRDSARGLGGGIGVCVCVCVCVCGGADSHGQLPLHSSFRRPQAAPRAMAPHRYIAGRSSAVQTEAAAGAAPPAPFYGKKRERCGRLTVGKRMFKIIETVSCYR